MKHKTLSTPFFRLEEFAPAEKLFVMTDIHGCYEAMERLLDFYDGKSKVVFMGDAIDRGAGSFEVVKRLLNLNAVTLFGNHEIMSHDYFYYNDFNDEGMTPSKLWFYLNGGETTLESFEKAVLNGEVNLETKVPDKYFPAPYDTYVKGCISHYLSGNILFCHAGLPTGRQLDFSGNPFDRENFDREYAWWRGDNEGESNYIVQRFFEGEKVFTVSGHTTCKCSSMCQPYGIRLDTGQSLKAALEIEPLGDTLFQYRIVLTECDKVEDPADVHKAYEELIEKSLKSSPI